MAIDISKLSYRVYLLRETGEMLDVTEISSGLGWEENDGELAAHLSVTLANIQYGGSYMSAIAKLNCYIIIYAEVGGSSQEVARGKIIEWNPVQSGSSDEVSLSCYDELYDLQASQDNRYVSDGTSTQSVIEEIFSDWGIPTSEYNGPSYACAKTTYKDEYLSDILLTLLDDALKHGDVDAFIRASEGKVSVLEKASNDTVYWFEEGKNLETANLKMSSADMVTVVKVVASEETDDGRQAVEALVEGKTEYGKRQVIYNRDSDDDLATATAAANEILAEDGEPEETMSVKVPDIPYVRKYDKVKITSRDISGEMLVLSIQHDIDGRSMTMDLTPIS
ncbi:MAG: hypothetical protein LUE24_14720 [Lachnospiraceae bacterium]|nr:hypothetical protein [Lachnospiraceae bacterium]